MTDESPDLPEVSPELLAVLPESLRAFVSKGGFLIQDDEDWEIEIEKPQSYLVKALPAGAVLIAGNGAGDHLFLTPAPDNPARLGEKVFAFWHERQRIEDFDANITSLVAPPRPGPTPRRPVLYHDGQTVQLGDEITTRSLFTLFRRRMGRVVYVPGISMTNRDMEHHGLCWVAITFAGGSRIGTLVDPKTSRLGKSIQFVKRSSEPFEEMQPQDRFE